MRFWWVRHGPTHRDEMIGWTNAPADLSDTAALARLDAHLPDDALLISSDLDRSIKTADAITANRTRLPHDANLREFNFGDWEQRNFADVSKTDPELSLQYWDTPGDAAPPNGESWNQASARASTIVDHLIKTHTGNDIIIVAHFGIILTQLQRASNLPATSALSFKIDNLSVTCVEHLGADTWQVLGVNHKP